MKFDSFRRGRDPNDQVFHLMFYGASLYQRLKEHATCFVYSTSNHGARRTLYYHSKNAPYEAHGVIRLQLQRQQQQQLVSIVGTQ